MGGWRGRGKIPVFVGKQSEVARLSWSMKSSSQSRSLAGIMGQREGEGDRESEEEGEREGDVCGSVGEGGVDGGSRENSGGLKGRAGEVVGDGARSG